MRDRLFAWGVPLGKNVAAMMTTREHGEQNSKNRNFSHVPTSVPAIYQGS